jgi:hypothetical protein
MVGASYSTPLWQNKGGANLMKASILLSLILIVLAPVFAAAQIDDSLILYLSFDEGDGEDAFDTSNYGNDGVLRGGPEWVDGKFGKALKFDGVDDYVEIPDNESLYVEEGVTLMAWVNLERYGFTGTDYQGIVAKGNTYRSYSLYSHVPTSGLHFSTSATAASTFYGSTTSGKTIPLNTWTHVAAIAATADTGGSHTYYIDGEPAGTTNFADLTTLPGSNDTGVVFVAKTAEGSRFLQGMIDEVRIWNRALSQTEVISQMERGSEGIISVQPQDKLANTWGNIKKQ